MSCVALLWLAAGSLVAADPPEVAKLKLKVAELETQVEVLTRENDQLKEKLRKLEGGKPQPIGSKLPIKQEVDNVEYELVRCWMNGDRWQLDFYVTSRRPQPYHLTFRRVVVYDSDGKSLKIDTDFLHPTKLTTDLRTKVAFVPGTLSAEKFPVIARLELYPRLVSKAPLLFKDIALERPAP